MIIDHLFTRPLFESQMDPITQFASNAHEEWRRNFDPTGTKPRIKKNSDGTEGDINVPFADLHPDWQKENLAAGHAAHRAVKHFGHDMEKAAEYVHSEWMKRNPKGDWNAAQHVPYDDLPEDEKEKDRVHVRTMMKLMGHHHKQGVEEVAPPGAKAERMVKHIKAGYAKDGKLTPKEKGIAYATAWKAHNAGRVEEQGVAEGSEPQVGDAVYYGKRLVGWFKGYSEHGKIITEPNYEEMGDEYANRDVYWDPQDKITIKPEQGVAEGHKESYIIVRTDREGKKDVFAGNFDTYERAQKELDACLAHPLHTKHKQKFEIKRKGHKDITEMDSEGVAEGFGDVVKGIKRVVKGKEDPKEVEHTYGRIARSAIKHKTPDQAEKDIKRWEKINKVVNKEGVAEGSTTMWEVCFDYGPHMSDTVKVKASSEDEAIAKVEKAAEKRGRSIDINWAKPAEQGVAEGQVNELSTSRLAQYKTAAAADAKQADQAGDVKRGDKRFSGIVKATKKQFDNDAKKIDESRLARQALMARIANSR